MVTKNQNRKMLDVIEGEKKYFVTSQLVTTNLSGYVWASYEKEAIEKFQAGEVIGVIDEEPTREEVNVCADIYEGEE